MNRTTRERLTPVLRWVHRWLGLTVGLLFTAVALSGSLLLFQPQFFEWTYGEHIPDDLAHTPGSVAAWLETGRAAVPELGNPIAIWRPHLAHNLSDAGMLIFAGREPGGLGNMGFVGVLVAPATGALLHVFDVDRSPAYAPLFLHRDLWAGASGRIVSGVMAIGVLLALLIGLYLWWPSPKQVLRKLSPRPWRVTLTKARRLHDFAGVWLAAALLVLTVSGLYLVQPGWVAPALGLLPGEHGETHASNAACGAPMGLDEAVAAAGKLVPGASWTALYPHDGQWEIFFNTPGRLGAEHGATSVLADLNCGTVVLHDSAASRGAQGAAELWLTGLHDGSVFGWVGELVVALIGLAPLLLAWTGVRIWLRGRREAMGRRPREAQTQAP